MSLAAFPTLSHGPSRVGYRRLPLADPVLRTGTADGRPAYRDLAFPVLYEEWIPYEGLTDADELLLRVWEADTVRFGAEPFAYANPYRDTTVILRLAEPMEFRKDTDTTWAVMMHTIEDPNDYAVSASASPSSSPSSSASSSISASKSSSPSSSISASVSSSASASISSSTSASISGSISASISSSPSASAS